MEIETQSGVLFDCLSQMSEEIDLTVKEGKREKTNAEIDAETRAKEILIESDEDMADKGNNDCNFSDPCELIENNDHLNVHGSQCIDESMLQLVVYEGPKDNDVQSVGNKENDMESDLIQQFLMDDQETPLEDLEAMVRNEIEYQFNLNKQAEINKMLCEGEKSEFDFVKVVPALRHHGKLAYIFKGRRFNKHKLNVNSAVIKCFNTGF